MVLNSCNIRITWETFETSQRHKAVSCFWFLSHFFPVFVSVASARKFSPSALKQERPGGLCDAGLFQAMGTHELEPQNTSAALLSSAHFSPSSFILFLRASPPTFFHPRSGSPCLPFRDSESFSLTAAASLPVGPLALPRGSLLTVSHCFPISAKERDLCSLYQSD